MNKRLEELGVHYNMGMDRYEYADGQPVSDMLDRDLKHGGDGAFPAIEAALSAPGNGPTDELSYKVMNPLTRLYERSSLPQPMARYKEASADMLVELLGARKKHGPMASAHEGFAVIMEEFDELKEHVWMKQKNRDHEAMRKELVQLGAMVIAMIVEVVDADNRR